MHVLALNVGSSSIKAAAIDSQSWRRLLQFKVEGVGSSGADRRAATERILDRIGKPAPSSRIDVVVHRIVHGGERFTGPARVDDEVVKHLEDLSHLAPLHNPPALDVLRAARQRLGHLVHIVAFDTSFHATLPEHAREYALPEDVRKQAGIRRFGFHGLSHAHVTRSVAAHLKREPQNLRIVSCHLGNGASVAAIESGRSVETSMGMTPLEGLVMGSRSGDLDPGILLVLLDAGWSKERLADLLNQGSGLKGLAGTNDMREIERRADAGDGQCRLALSIYTHRIRKYLGAYAAVLGGVDSIAFTGGVGENSAVIRHGSVQRLDHLGAMLDENRNRSAKVDEAHPCVEISTAESRVRLFVVAADEEMEMARAAMDLLRDESGSG